MSRVVSDTLVIAERNLVRLRRAPDLCVAAYADQHGSFARFTHECMQRPRSGSISMIEYGRSRVIKRDEQLFR